MIELSRATAVPRTGVAAEARFLVPAAGAVGLVFLYGVAAALDASSASLALIFLAVVAAVPVFGWWAFARIPPPLRRLCGALALGATLWLVGTVLWTSYFLTRGESPQAVGPWDAVFAVAYLLALGAVVVELRSAIAVRHAALDASVLFAAGLALGAAFVGGDLTHEVSPEGAATLARPLLAVLMLTLIVSAALGAWTGVPLSVALVGTAQVFIAVGGLIYSYRVVEYGSADMRWPGLSLAIGAGFGVAAAGVVILERDRLLRVVAASRIPHHPLGAKAVLLVALGALGVTLGVSLYGQATDNRALLLVGLITSVWIGTATAIRARNSLLEVERAYAELERAHVSLERVNDDLKEANEELARANVEVRTTHLAFEQLLVLADERTAGGLRDLIEEAGEDLAEFLRRDRAGE